MTKQTRGKGIDRRRFFRSTAAVGSGLLASATASSVQSANSGSGDINVALIGIGDQGQALLTACLQMPGIRFKALCDIWSEYNLKEASHVVKVCGHEHRTYLDYQEMLAKEKDLQAAIIATPDFCHADQTVACLKAGLHVYCESPMSNTLEGARRMAQATRETGKLLQIGQQRRSNPRYIHCCQNLLREVNLLGRLTTASAQWNRSLQPDRGWPMRAPVEDAVLAKFGYKSMAQFRNWRWYKELGAGPVVESASHQIDIFNWFLGARPKSVMASAGTDYFDKKTHECHDTALAIFEYETSKGAVRASYHAVNTNGNLGYYEKFLGDQGALVISEAGGLANVYREASAPDWEKWVALDYLLSTARKEGESASGAAVSVTATIAPVHYSIPVKFTDPYPKPHLENFFAAIGGKAKLNCPADVAYATAVSVFKMYESVESGRKADLKPDDFKA